MYCDSDCCYRVLHEVSVQRYTDTHMHILMVKSEETWGQIPKSVISYRCCKSS